MTQQQKLDLKLIVWGCGIILTVLGTTFRLGQKVSNESNKVYNSVEAVRAENRLQDKDIEILKDREQTNRLEIDIVRTRVDKLETRYGN